MSKKIDLGVRDTRKALSESDLEVNGEDLFLVWKGVAYKFYRSDLEGEVASTFGMPLVFTRGESFMKQFKENVLFGAWVDKKAKTFCIIDAVSDG